MRAVPSRTSKPARFRRPVLELLEDRLSPAVSVTTLLANPNPSTFGQPVTFTASVNGTDPMDPTPTGQVEFREGATVLGSVTLVPFSGPANATFITGPTQLTGGTHLITAFYLGDSFFDPSQSAPPVSQVVTLAGTSTDIVDITPSPSIFGQLVTFTIEVSPAINGVFPTGTVTLREGGQTLGSGTLAPSSNGGGAIATITVPPDRLRGGQHTISADYSGDVNYQTSSTSEPPIHTVNPAPSTVTITSASPAPSPFGQPATFTITVTPTIAGILPTGTLTLLEGNTDLGPSTPLANVNGVATATFTTSGLAIGDHFITAIYPGDANYRNAGSASFLHTVSRATTTTTLTPSNSAPVKGEQVTFTALVQGVVSGMGTPTGSVRFIVDGVAQAPVQLDVGGQAVFVTAFVTPGTHTVQADYLGDSRFAPSTGTSSVRIGTPVQAFLDKVYQDLLGRSPTPAEVATWTAILERGRPRSVVTKAIVNSREFRIREMNMIFDICLPCHHDPMEEGPDDRVNIPLVNKTVEQMKAEIMGTEVYYIQRARRTPARFVTAIFGDLLHRAPRPGEMRTYLALLQKHTRSQVAAKLLATPEYFRAVTRDLFQQYVKRPPTAQEVQR